MIAGMSPGLGGALLGGSYMVALLSVENVRLVAEQDELFQGFAAYLFVF